MGKSAAIVILVSVVLAIPAATWAAGYIGGGVGASFVKYEVKDLEVEDFQLSGADIAYKIFVGYKVIPFLSFEGGYRNLGKVTDKENDVEVESKTSGWDIQAMGILPLGMAHVWIKAGYIWWSSDSGVPNELKNSDGADFMWGLGGDLSLLGIALRAEWEKMEIENADHVSMFSVGATLGF